MKFSVLSWNVEAFKGTQAQLISVAAHINNLNPDMFGLFEVENVDIISLVSQHLPDYDYYLTDGPENKEILVGARKGKFEHLIFSQKREFKAYNPALRPGALMSVTIGGVYYNVMFLHTDSGTEAPSFGNRNEMFEKIESVKKALDKKTPGGGGAKFIVLGDLNTMGLRFPLKKKADTKISEMDEIQALQNSALVYHMVLLPKEFNRTFNNGKYSSNLDHVLATDNLTFKNFGLPESQEYYVRVDGWQQLSGAARKDFIQNISDHCSLYCEVV